MRATIVLAAVMLLVACGRKSLDEDDVRLQAALRATWEAAARAKSVDAFHVAFEYDEDYARFKDQPRILEYPIREKVSVPRAAAEPLLATLTNSRSYTKLPVDCSFVPHHVVRLPPATLVICVKCGEVEFILDGKSKGTYRITPDANQNLRVWFRARHLE